MAHASLVNDQTAVQSDTRQKKENPALYKIRVQYYVARAILTKVRVMVISPFLLYVVL